tara:strand:+ start:401 stop:829 length:429 start_codon:yes stop_codon:yes gene_type:complete
MKQKFLFAYMDVAERFAKLSHARRLQVGAIVVKDDRIISIGYNGMPSGWDNDCEDIIAVDELEPTYKTKKQVLHAESNAITKLAKSTESGNKSTMFCTHSPCIECAKLIFQTGIDTLYYRKDYRSTDGIDFLKASGVTVEQI